MAGEPRVRKHCPTCACPQEIDSLTVYPPNEKLYGRCLDCGEVSWRTYFYKGGVGSPMVSAHCACCTHPHNLPPGGHDSRCLADPSECQLAADDPPAVPSSKEPTE